MNASMPIRHDDEVDLIAFLRVLWDSKLIIVLTATLFAIGSIYVALTATPIYSASVVVTRVGDSNMGGAASLASQFGGLGSLVGMNIGGGGPGQESQAVLNSRRLTEEFIVRGGLLADLSPDGDDTFTLWRAVKQFREQILSVRQDETNGTTTVSIEWTDPVTAARWANDYVALANEIIRTQAQQESERNIEYLNEQIAQTNAVELQRVMYNLIEAETKTLMLANARAEFAFSSIDPAVAPEVRSRPKRKIIVVSGVALGLLFGVLIVFALNVFRQVWNREASNSK